MLFNSSSNTSSPSTYFCFSNSFFPYFFHCFNYTLISTQFTAYTCTNLLLLLPIYLLVLWEGIQHWLGRGYSSASDSDVFIHHGVVLEVIGALGLAFYSFSVYTCGTGTIMFGYYTVCLTYPGQTLFHCLTCGERYMAIVHPIMYRRQRKEVLMRVRKACAAAVWLFSTGLMYYSIVVLPDVPSLVFLAISVVVVFVINFCSFSVLHALVRLGMWKVGGDKRQIDPSKKRAFHLAMAVTGALWLRLCGLMCFNIAFHLEKRCTMMFLSFWFFIPSSLALPVMFLQRAGTWHCRSSSQEN